MRGYFKAKLKSFSLPGRNAHGKVPEHLHEGICAYIVDGVTPGGFFNAVVCNDLRGAFERGDLRSVHCLQAIITFMHTQAPASCWGSVERMVTWQRERQGKPLTQADWLIDT